MRFELMTSSLPRRRSTPELRGQEPKSLGKTGAGDEIRTRDPQLGRLMLYQLSYTRPNHIVDCPFSIANLNYPRRKNQIDNRQLKIGNDLGAGGRIRTCVGREPAGFTARCH